MQAIRLVAGVIAKNAVGSSWRKTLGSREWSKVPDQEKAAVRSAAARLLLSEDSHRVSVQLGLLITNIARYAANAQSLSTKRRALGTQISSGSASRAETPYPTCHMRFHTASACQNAVPQALTVPLVNGSS